MSKIKSYIGVKFVTVILSVIGLLLVVPLGAFNHSLKFFCQIWIYYYIFQYLSSYYGEKEILTILIFLAIPAIIIYGSIYLYLPHSPYKLPSLISPLIGIIIGFILLKLKRDHKVLITYSLVLITLLISFSGFKIWLHKFNYGTFTGKVGVVPSPNFHLKDGNNNIINIKSLNNNRMVILDFWTTSCTPCFKNFPLFESYFKKYKDDSSINFFSVNIPNRGESIGVAENIIKDLGYTFPVLYTPNDSILNLLNFNIVPTVIVIDKHKNIIYRGDLNGIKRLGI